MESVIGAGAVKGQMHNVIWGAGYYASLFTVQLGRENVSFYVDMDRSKSGDFLGRKVVHPDDVSDWRGLHIYVPFNYYEEISIYLLGKGLREGLDFSMYDERITISWEQAKAEYLRACREVDSLSERVCEDAVPWLGYFWATKETYRQCLSALTCSSNKIVLIANTPWYFRYEITDITGCDAIVMPSFMSDFVSVAHFDAAEEARHIEENEEVGILADKFHLTQQDGSWDECVVKASYCYSFLKYLFTKCKFSKIVIESSDDSISVLAKSICEKYGVAQLYTHPGLLPGTIMMGAGGDVGNSMPTMYYKAFNRLPLDGKYVDLARDVLKYLYDSRANRKTQPKNDSVVEAKKRINSLRPTILCMGQNDLSSCMVPYTEMSRKYHSPIFKTSLEFTTYIANLCQPHGWNVIYKSHPMFMRYEDESVLPKNVVTVSQGDVNELIDMADVVVTVRSTVNYIALIRHKPVLMLGYTQTRGQGCTYEAFCVEDVAPQLEKAVSHGLTESQQQAFLEHVARLLQYYLYDDLSERPIRYGITWPDKVEEFFVLANRLQAIEVKMDNDL